MKRRPQKPPPDTENVSTTPAGRHSFVHEKFPVLCQQDSEEFSARPRVAAVFTPLHSLATTPVIAAGPKHRPGPFSGRPEAILLPPERQPGTFSVAAFQAGTVHSCQPQKGCAHVFDWKTQAKSVVHGSPTVVRNLACRSALAKLLSRFSLRVAGSPTNWDRIPTATTRVPHLARAGAPECPGL